MDMSKNVQSVGISIFFITLRLFGRQGAYFLLCFVAIFYILTPRLLKKRTFPYLKRRFPHAGPLKRLCYSFRLYYSFGVCVIDTVWQSRFGSREHAFCIFPDRSQLIELIRQGKGLILLTAHVGGWQFAMSNLGVLPVTVNALMHQDEEDILRRYVLSSEELPFRIIRNDVYLGGMIESITALASGEVVTIMGDRHISGRYVSAPFLGGSIRLPVTPFALSAASGAPIAVLFINRQDRRQFCIKIWDVLMPFEFKGMDRQEFFNAQAIRYVRALEAYVHNFPFQWFNFFDCWVEGEVSCRR